MGHSACMCLQMAIGMGDASGLYGYSIKTEVRCLMKAVARDGARTKIIILMRESFCDNRTVQNALSYACAQLSKLAGTCKEPPKKPKKKQGAPESDL